MSFLPSDVSLKNEQAFNAQALDVFFMQSRLNMVYNKYINELNIDIKRIKHYKEIPFLPIQFFKNHIITTHSQRPPFFFESSGTGGIKSKHYYNTLALYEESFLGCFNMFFGDISQKIILALLPSYADNPNSSLIYMVNRLIELSNNNLSGFYHKDEAVLIKKLSGLQKDKKECILFGVTHALIDFGASFKLYYPELVIIETGGMKGQKKELVRQELHSQLSMLYGTSQIYSEYGMTELFSQAYATKNGIFKCPPWMRVLARDMNDPLSIMYNKNAVKGALNIIDLANKNTISFIATEDIGTVYPDNTFSVDGRMDKSVIRGCNLLI